MDEQIIFSAANVVVTPTRFQVPGQTFTMSGITSVKSVSARPITGPILLAAAGVVVVLASEEASAIAIGVAMIIGASAWLVFGAKHVVALSSASGEVKAFFSRDRKLVDGIVGALNDAIVRRG